MTRLRKAFAKTNRAIKNIDIYGRPITLFHQGNSTFKTTVGGYLSVITGIVIVAYILSSIASVVQQNYNVKTDIKVLNAYDDTGKYILNKTNFELAFNFTLSIQNATLQQKVSENLEKYFDVQLVRIVKGDSENEVEINKQNCSGTKIGRKQQDISELLVNESYYQCFNFSRLGLYGSDASELTAFYEMQISPCNRSNNVNNPNKTCAEEEEVDAVITNSIMQTVIFSEFFNDTVKGLDSIQIVPNIYYFNYNANQSFSQELLIKKNNLTLRDSFLYESLGEIKSEFYSAELAKVSVGSIVPGYFPMFKLEIKRNFEEYYITRNRLTLLDSLSDIGGFISLIQYTVKFGFFFYMEDKYKNSVLQKFFKTQKNLFNKEKKKMNKITARNNKLIGDQRGLFETLYTSLQQREPLKVNPMRKYLKFFCCCKKRDLQTLFLEDSADKQLFKQLSIDAILNSYRHTRLISILMLNKMQRMLIPFTFENLVMTKPNSTDDKKYMKLMSHSKIEMGSPNSPEKLLRQTFKDQYEEDLSKKQKNQNCLKLAAALECCIKNQDQKINRKLLKQLINYEERDFSEQVILLRAIQGLTYGDWTKKVMKQNGPQFTSESLSFQLKEISDPSISLQNLQIEEDKQFEVQVRQFQSYRHLQSLDVEENNTERSFLETRTFKERENNDLDELKFSP